MLREIPSPPSRSPEKTALGKLPGQQEVESCFQQSCDAA